LNASGQTLGATDDALLTRLVSAASTFVTTWLDRQLLQASYLETRSGKDTSTMAALQWPVTAVSSVTVDGVAITARTAFGGSGFYFDSDFLYLDGFSFTRGRANVQLAYTAGYTVVPFDVEQAVIEIIALRYRERDRIGQVSKNIAGEVVTFLVKDMPPSALSALLNYKRVIPT
jgi:hypothetical protein